MMVSLMIVISIMRMTQLVSTRPWLKGTLWALHVVAMPILVAGVAWLVYLVSELGIGEVVAKWNAVFG
jgi:hypothetical protein